MASPQGYTHLRSYRYERKFLVETLSLHQVQALVKLHPQLFYQPYPPRYVNNLYLDTADMENYYDNVGGSSRRRKVRVRWYGDLLGEMDRPLLEFKVKDGLVGTKHTYPLAKFCLDDGFGDRQLWQAAQNSDLAENVWRELRNLRMVLLNRYYRHYYVSRGGAFRLTLDSQQSFYKANGALGNSFVHRQVNARDVIVELKYELEHEARASRVVSFFPFRVTRNSKYVQGMERVYF